jgi:hypothetical protein
MGVWREMCYCEDRDGCNRSTPNQRASLVTMTSILSISGLAVLALTRRLLVVDVV